MVVLLYLVVVGVSQTHVVTARHHEMLWCNHQHLRDVEHLTIMMAVVGRRTPVHVLGVLGLSMHYEVQRYQ